MNTDDWAAPPVPPGVTPGGSPAAHFELTIPARPESLAVVRHALTEFGSRIGVDPSYVDDVKLAVGEACTAAVLTEGPDILVSFDVLEGGSLEVRIVHTPGEAFSAPEDTGRDVLHSLLLYSLARVVQSETHEGQIVTHVAKIPR